MKELRGRDAELTPPPIPYPLPLMLRCRYSPGLSDFLSQHVLGNDDYTTTDPSWARKTDAATLAMKMAMDHFMFEGTHSAVRLLFVQELEEEKFKKGEVVCRERGVGDKLYELPSEAKASEGARERKARN